MTESMPGADSARDAATRSAGPWWRADECLRIGLTPTGLRFVDLRGPLALGEAERAALGQALDPIVAATLPKLSGTGSALRSVATADWIRLWFDGPRLVGFAAMDAARLGDRKAAYATFGAIEPAHQGGGLSTASFRQLFADLALDALVLTTNGPASYRSLEKIVGPDGAVWPDRAGEGPPPALHAQIRDLVARALGREPATFDLDRQLVRRGCRSTDPQAEPMDAYLADERWWGEVRPIARLFREGLGLRTGDAVVLVAIQGPGAAG